MNNDPKKDPSRCIWVATDASNALVRITGRASFATGPAFKRLGSALIEQCCTRLVLDMADCEGADSTFLGVLAGLASRMKKNCNSTIVVINLSPAMYENVCTLGLNRLMDCHEAGRCPEEVQKSLGRLGALDRVDIVKADEKAERETAIEAHENLIRSDSRNLPRFKDVLTFLKESS